MSGSTSDKSLLRRVNAATNSAAEEVDQKYRAKLMAKAEQDMAAWLRRHVEPEDIVQSALGTVFRRTAQGQLHFEHTGQLWQYLVTVTRNKIIKQAVRARAKKRPKLDADADVAELLGRGPTADQQAIARDLIENLLQGLDQSYSKIALLLAEGHSERAIAGQLDCSRRRVAGKIARLRERLRKLEGDDGGQVD